MTNQAQNPNDKKDFLKALIFCPKCGSKLEPREHDKQIMPSCVNEGCGFIFWQNSKPCVVTIILNEAGHVLMTKRGIEPDKGKLDLPGGFVMLGELPEDAAVRETKEELGVDVEVIDFIGFAIDKYYYQGFFETTLIAAYLVEIVSGKPYVADRNEIGGIEWVDPDAFDPGQLAFSNNEGFLEMINRNSVRYQELL